MADRLRDYRGKRRGGRTPEPGVEEPGRETSADAERPAPGEGDGRFVVDWHSARRLHYDLRLELDGVAKSWAVPKGPPLHAGVKRLAVQTEDHPLEYLDWEGDIPAGEYGAGKMRIWDRGTFALEKRSKRELKLVFHGEKLRGSYVIVRTRGERDWLLMKHRAPGPEGNAPAPEGNAPGPQENAPGPEQSPLASGRAEGSPHASADAGRRGGLGHSGYLEVEGPQRLPVLGPMLACAGRNEAFDDPDWSFEVKWDGVRTLAFVADGEVLLRSRGNHNVTSTFPELSSLHRAVRATEAILDGEIVALDERGVSDFQLLQPRLGRRGGGGPGSAAIVYYVFDVLLADAEDLTVLAWEERRRRLADVLEPSDSVRLSEAVEETGVRFYEAALAQGAEGVIAKRRGSPYRPGARSPDWVKIKVRETDCFWVGGYTRGIGSRGGSFGALLLGERRDGELRYVGNVGTGFSDAVLEDALERLRPLERPDHPFATGPPLRQPVTWVEPELACEVEYAHRTRDGRLRAPSFKGWVEKEPTEAVPGAAVAASGGPGGAAIQARAGGVGEEASTLTNLDKPFWPEVGLTKGHLLAYYEAVAPFLLPHLEGRPMILNRFPNGWQGKSFYQKNAPEHRPDWVETVRLPADEGRKTIEYVLCPDERHLLWLVNLGCIEMNPWLSRLPQLADETQILFDLDPNPPASFSDAVEVARRLRELLDRLELQSFPKTSGGKGMHVMVPIEPGLTHEFARLFAEGVAGALERRSPDLVTTAHAKERRGGRVLVDFRQNRQGSSIASVYSARPRERAPVSTPLRWEEVDEGLDPSLFSFDRVLDRCREHGDLFEPVLNLCQPMTPAVEALPRVLAG